MVYHRLRDSAVLGPSHPIYLHILFSTRQYASAFNQPLSLDTSKATDMRRMFSVRSAHALPPIPSWVILCVLLALPTGNIISE